MERTMTVEERIRRAEDIYNRRNGGYSSFKDNKKGPIRVKRGRTKKLLKQILIFLIIYIVFYSINNREYVFSEDFRKGVTDFFTEKTKISEWYSNTREFILDKIDKNYEKDHKNGEQLQKIEEETEKKKEEKQEEKKVENIEENLEGNKERKSLDENIGGAKEKSEQEKVEKRSESNKEVSELELMEKDAREIKEKISFIPPIKGRISSTFGWRNPTTEGVPKYHTGLDIAAKEGTVIKSATDGKIIMASSKGDYGNHYQIKIEDVVIIYAHCKKLYLKEGDIVKQGQNIAEVGTTGNSTGPHLHFEIRKGDKKIDPQLVVNF